MKRVTLALATLLFAFAVIPSADARVVQPPWVVVRWSYGDCKVWRNDTGPWYPGWRAVAYANTYPEAWAKMQALYGRRPHGFAERMGLAETAGHRSRKRLLNPPTPEALLATVIAEAYLNARAGAACIEWEPSCEKDGYFRVWAQFPISEITFDQLFNGRPPMLLARADEVIERNTATSSRSWDWAARRRGPRVASPATLALPPDGPRREPVVIVAIPRGFPAPGTRLHNPETAHKAGPRISAPICSPLSRTTMLGTLRGFRILTYSGHKLDPTNHRWELSAPAARPISSASCCNGTTVKPKHPSTLFK